MKRRDVQRKSRVSEEFTRSLVGEGEPARKLFKRMGFTLIELLVVISIIAILASMLLPTLRECREISKNQVCASNLKQFSILTSLYASDNDGFLPPCYWKSSAFRLVTVLDSYQKFNFSNPKTYHDARSQILFCPSSSPVDEGTYRSDYSGNTHLMPDSECSFTYWSIDNGWCRLSRPLGNLQIGVSGKGLMDPEIYGVPKTPSNRMLMTDGSGERHSIYHPNRIRFRHRKKANFLYVDGHVAPYTPTTIPAFETSTVGRPVTGPETMDCVLTTW